MSAQAVVEVLDDVGGWVRPDELDYQLATRGLNVNPHTIAGLCREGRVSIEPAGYTLSDRELDARRIVPQPRKVPRPRNPKTATELILATMHDSESITWWRRAKLESLIDRAPSTIQRALHLLVEVELCAYRTGGPRYGRGGSSPYEYALCERVQAGVLA